MKGWVAFERERDGGELRSGNRQSGGMTWIHEFTRIYLNLPWGLL
jgi:hypothetical protein